MLQDWLILLGVIIPAGLVYLTNRLTARSSVVSSELEKDKAERDARTQSFADMEGFLRRHNADLLQVIERQKAETVDRQQVQDERIAQMERFHLETLRRIDLQQGRIVELEQRAVESERRENLMTRYVYQLRDLLRQHGVLAPAPPDGLHFDGASTPSLLD